MATATRPTKPTAAPTCLEECPEYQAASDKLHSLQMQRNEKDATLAALTEKYLDSKGKHFIDTAADDLLNGTTPNMAELQNDLGNASRELEIFESAVRKQSEVVSAERRKASTAVRRGKLAEHQQLGNRIHAALLELKAAVLAESEFRDMLEREGLGFGAPLESVAFSAIGDPRDDYSALGYYLREFPANYLNQKG